VEPTQRPAHGRPLSPLTGDSSLSSVIAAFLEETDAGEDRELRSALGHVDAEVGTMAVRSIRPRHLTAMVDDLHHAGLSPRREAAVNDALRAVFAFAVAHRLVAVNPMAGPAPVMPRSGPSPTYTMLALGARMAFWTTWLVAIGFLALLLLLLVELG
jgi:hypothetical protein